MNDVTLGAARETTINVGADWKFGSVLALAFNIFAALPLIHGGSIRIWALAVATVFLITTTVNPRLLHPLNILWFRLGLLLGRVTTPIVMSGLFFLVFTPTAIIMRLSGKDPLRRKFDPKAATYWIQRDKANPMGSMKHQF
jgi:hypothetical protein